MSCGSGVSGVVVGCVGNRRRSSLSYFLFVNVAGIPGNSVEGALAVVDASGQSLDARVVVSGCVAFVLKISRAWSCGSFSSLAEVEA